MKPRPLTAPPAFGGLYLFLWLLFLVWTVLAAVVLSFDIGPAQISQWIYARDLRSALITFAGITDSVWIVLAAALAYLEMVRRESLPTARQWSLIILGGAALLLTIGVWTGLPFGPRAFTGRLGWHLPGGVPCALPLFWLLLVVCSRYVVLTFRPRSSRQTLALGTGVIALLTDLNLEPVAWKVRAYWIWYPAQQNAQPHPPWENYATWFAAATILALAFPNRRVAGTLALRPWKPALILGLVNAVLLLVHLTRWLRNP